MRKVFLVLFLLATIGATGQQQEEMVSVPKSKLTDQQKAELKIDTARSWVGMGKEVGEAVNSSLAAISTQSNNFAQTPVGKLTAFIVIWKVIGDQAVHVIGGLAELLIFVPVWLWSYRRMCMTRRLKTSKDAWQVIPYESKGDFTPRVAHTLAAVVIVGVILSTVFSY